MIVQITCAKVGHCQAPHIHAPALNEPGHCCWCAPPIVVGAPPFVAPPLLGPPAPPATAHPCRARSSPMNRAQRNSTTVPLRHLACERRSPKHRARALTPPRPATECSASPRAQNPSQRNASPSRCRSPAPRAKPDRPSIWTLGPVQAHQLARRLLPMDSSRSSLPSNRADG
jgi:hypothetical protein